MVNDLMRLDAELITHRDQILADLDAAHDYFIHSQAAWRIVRVKIGQGGSVTVRNRSTGSVITERELPDQSQNYVSGFLTISTFQQFVSLFEDFIFGLIRHWLIAYPQRLERKQISMSVVFSAADLDEVKLAAVNRELYDLSYKKVRDWFAYLEDLAKLGCPSPGEIDLLAEIKATRDVFVHNRGVASHTYEEKSGSKKRAVAGNRLEIPKNYHRESWELIRKVVLDVSVAAIAKA